MELKTALINRLDEARAGLEDTLKRIDPTREIYPSWTIKQMLDHISGWDDAVTASLRAHLKGKTPATPADRGIDHYNEQTVSTRESIDLQHTLDEFRASRRLLVEVILNMPEDKVVQPLVVPWGPRGTLSEVIEIFAEHEETHTADLLRWLEDPQHPLTH